MANPNHDEKGQFAEGPGGGGGGRADKSRAKSIVAKHEKSREKFAEESRNEEDSKAEKLTAEAAGYSAVAEKSGEPTDHLYAAKANVAASKANSAIGRTEQALDHAVSATHHAEKATEIGMARARAKYGEPRGPKD